MTRATMIRPARTYTLTEFSELTGIDSSIVLTFIERQWIRPVAEDAVDDEDVARIHLIQELKHCFGANDEAIPLILHLLDQLYCLREQIRRAP